MTRESVVSLSVKHELLCMLLSFITGYQPRFGGVWGWHNCILPERWREWVIVLCVCVCVCVTEGQMSALCCAAGLLCSSCTCAVRLWHLAVPYYPRTALLRQWRTNGPCAASLCVLACVSVFHNLTTDAFQVSERLCVCHHTLYLIAVSTFLFAAYPSLIITAFRKSYSSYGNCIRPAER